MLTESPSDRGVAPEAKLRSPIGQLLHLCEVFQPGKHFVQRIFNQVSVRPVRASSAKFHVYRKHARHDIIPTDPTGS